DGCADAGAVGRVGLRAVVDVPFDGGTGRTVDGAGGVVEQRLLLLWRHQPEQGPRLLEVVIVVGAVVVTVGAACQRQGRFGVVRLRLPVAVAVGGVARHAPLVAVDAHLAVTVVGV